ncbi:MAG: ATP-dependent zinc metalloprotease FtsH [Lachnospiraceae bacterium]|nr:ATP-dependent zinc metalloprotease FtsH [Lachnospiraceae bacterium]
MNDNSDQNNNDQEKKKKRSPQSWMLLILLVCLLVLLLSFFSDLFLNGSKSEVTYNEFLSMLEKDEVESVTVKNNRYYIKLKDGVQRDDDVGYSKTSYYTGLMNDESILQTMLDHNVKVLRSTEDPSNGIIEFILVYILPIVLFLLFMSFLFKKIGSGSGIMGVGKSTAKVYVQKETGITFKDVAGEDEAKESLKEIVDFLHDPQKYAEIGARLPKGALLVGPPGTGKTLLAKAVAGEAEVPFFSLSGSDFVEMFVGVGASRVRDLFKQAQQNAPCIIFIDEIDAIGKSRDSHLGGNDEREQTLNQLLSEMDGFDSSKGLIVLGATNRPEILDKALLRPGRFDRRIIVEKPDLKGRVNILKVHAEKVKLDETVDFEAIGLATSGAVGSDLANMINEAAINAVKEGRKAVSQKDLLYAVEVVLVGKEKKDRVLNEQERRIVSYHEIGHALTSALLKNSEPVQKITIVPRTMGALGFVMHTPEEERYLNTKEELEERLISLLGGRAAEEVVFGSITTGASNDIEQATNIARSMITMYGMSEKFGLMGLETVEDQYLTGRKSLNCSDETAAEIDREVMQMLKVAYERSKELLIQNREILDELAAFLIERETITGQEFMEIFHRLRAEKGIEPPADYKKKAEEAKDQAEAAVSQVETEVQDTATAEAETETASGTEEVPAETPATDTDTGVSDDSYAIGSEDDPKDGLL